MKTLDTTFTTSGFIHEQVERTGNIAIYRRYKRDNKGQLVGREHFEVVRVGYHNGFKIPGTDKTAPPAETYPGPEQWGARAWTFLELQDARDKAEELIAEETK